MAPDDTPTGTEYPEEVQKAIVAADCLLLLFSKSANDSIFVRKEVERAVSHKKRIIPIILERFTPSSGFEFLLSNVQWIDAVGLENDEVAELAIHSLDATARAQTPQPSSQTSVRLT